eukprot:CAMPEP_0119060216 /NCGR_PEP_ID=MMETSP1178-20130426/4220_1 /TAXON_ID=33656 /ORGANISM="unid sp, Strain CCMP2000" /LENGTH=586 /DNA_ID=CAMNT_0007041301 /DNA_START=38 /DNA_END=1798 /DNA_ORIENTATION=-
MRFPWQRDPDAATEEPVAGDNEADTEDINAVQLTLSSTLAAEEATAAVEATKEPAAGEGAAGGGASEVAEARDSAESEIKVELEAEVGEEEAAAAAAAAASAAVAAPAAVAAAAEAPPPAAVELETHAGEASADVAEEEEELRRLDEEREAEEAALRSSFEDRRRSLESEAPVGMAGDEEWAATGDDAEPTMEDLVAAGVIKNLDTGEVFCESSSVRNLDTGEIMSVDHLAEVYALAPENAFDWCERHHHPPAHPLADSGPRATVGRARTLGSADVAAAPRATIARGISLGLFGGGGGGGGGASKPNRRASRVDPSDKDLAKATGGEEVHVTSASQLSALDEHDGLRLCERVAVGVRDLRNLSEEARGRGSFDTMAHCHGEMLEGCSVIIDLAVYEADQACFEVVEGLLYETMEAITISLGMRHPTTLRLLAKLSQFLHLRGRSAEAEEIYLTLALADTKTAAPATATNEADAAPAAASDRPKSALERARAAGKLSANLNAGRRASQPSIAEERPAEGAGAQVDVAVEGSAMPEVAAQEAAAAAQGAVEEAGAQVDVAGEELPMPEVVAQEAAEGAEVAETTAGVA